MNKIAAPLFVIGWICIGAGLILGLTNMEQIVGFEDYTYIEDEPITETNWTLFFSYLIAGLITGFMMFGFAEIVNLLDKGNQIKERIEVNLKNQNGAEKDLLKEAPRTVPDDNKKESIERELVEIENNNTYSTDMKNAMKAMVKRREGIK